MTFLVSVLVVVSQAMAPAPVIVPPESPPPAPYVLDWYFTCVAANARGDALKGYSDKAVEEDVRKACGFIAAKATAQLSQEDPGTKTATRWSHDYGIVITPKSALTNEAVLKASDRQAVKVATLARAEQKRK